MLFDIVQRLPISVGQTLHFRKAQCASPRANIHICHGLAEHSARYKRFAQALNVAGYNVYAHDHRGHGTNITATSPMGMFAPKNGASVAISDILALNHHIRLTSPALPIILFGHSMGGLLALNYLFKHSQTIDAAAIWNANFKGNAENFTARTILRVERMLKGSDVPSSILPKLTFRAWANTIADARTPFDWLSHDPTEIDTYIADPLCGFNPSVALWLDIFLMMKNGSSDDNFSTIRKNMPFNLIGGAQDPATDNGQAVSILAQRMSAMGFQKISCTIYAQSRHESLNELNRDEVTTNFLNWLDEALPTSAISG